MNQEFFLCCDNCARWGQPKKKGRKVILCEEEFDENNIYYSPNHPACKDFIPLQGASPTKLEIFKLLVQSLSIKERDELQFLLNQSNNLIGRADCQGISLALGDYVAFKWMDNSEYSGIVEGADERYDAIRIFCPAFPSSSISLVGKSLRKINENEAKVLAKQKLSEFNEGTLQWHLECLTSEIQNLKNKEKENLTPDEYQQYLDYLLRWAECDSRLRYNVAISQSLK